MKKLVLLFVFLISFNSKSQTLVMNEVSNGPSGSKEYVEFVVTSNTVVYNCVGTTTPPCIDIRGWIYDDNSGYHGAAGIAGGCIRFSNDPFWSCIPVGTILLIYNDTDPNADIPPNDLSLNDGNCRLIIPVNNPTLFDQNSTTPGAAACSYPAAGWAAGGLWSNTGLLNASDCARIVDLGGCEVFSVCYGANNLNTLIYFPGSGASRVMFFSNNTNNNPNLNANWTYGCANAGTCGTNDQTPGAPNNAANAAWIGSMNNNCAPITSLAVVSNTTAGTCPCSAVASVTASGSIPGYSYTWSPAPGNGQGTPIASGLCTGTYSCIVQSTITNCTQTVIVNVTNGGSLSINASNTGSYCSGSTIQLNTTSADSYTWSGPGGFNSSVQNPTIAASTTTMSGTYSLLVTVGGCTATATTSVTINSSPSATAANSGAICEGQSVNLTGGNGSNYLWNGPSGFTTNLQSPTIAIASLANAGTYTLMVTAANNCTNIALTNVTVNTLPTILISGANACVGSSFSLSSSGGNSFSWSGPNSFTSLNQNPIINNSSLLNSGIYSVTVTNSSNCVKSATVNITINPLPIATASGSDVCEGATLNLTSANSANYMWTGPNNFTSSIQNPIINNVSVLNSGPYILTVSNTNSCVNSASIFININPQPNISIATNGNTFCKDSTCKFFANSNGTSFSWTGPNGFSSIQQSPVVPNLSSTNGGLYTVIVSDVKGCIASSNISILINDCLPDVFIPEGFSPNGDGAHDFFVITGIDGRKTEINIYNRWGNLIYNNKDYLNNWAGKTKSGLKVSGEDLPSGTYYYIVNIINETKARTGFVTLWR